MKENFTSIIIQLYDFNRLLRAYTKACLGNIRKFTEGKDYEIILIDNKPCMELRDEFDVFKPEVHIINEKDKGCFASYNQGAELAKGDVLVFTQNDVFVHEGWLKHMRYYIDKDLTDVIYPDQYPRTREFVEKSYQASYEDKHVLQGGRDAGLMMISTEGFKKTGGWPEGIKGSIIGWKFMFDRITKAGLRWRDTNKAIITHIRAGTNKLKLAENPELYAKEMLAENKFHDT